MFPPHSPLVADRIVPVKRIILLFMNKEPSVNKSVHYPKRLALVSLFLLFLAYWQNCHFLRVLKLCLRARQNLANVPESCQNGTYLPACMLARFTWTGLLEYGND